MVTIKNIHYEHCEAIGKPNCQNLENGTVATIGVVVQNASPWAFMDDGGRNTQFYRLLVGTRSEPYRDGMYRDKRDTRCKDPPEPGYGGGLLIRQAGGYPGQLQEPGIFLNLPYDQSEILLDVERDPRRNIQCRNQKNPIDFETTGKIQCDSYHIFVRLVSDCEYNTDTYQYRTSSRPPEGEEKSGQDLEIIYPRWEDPRVGPENPLSAETDDDSPEVGRWKSGTEAHFPLRGIGDAVSDASFFVSWKPDAADTGLNALPPHALDQKTSSSGTTLLVAVVVSAVVSAIFSAVITFRFLRPTRRVVPPRYSAVDSVTKTERHHLLPSKLEILSNSAVC